MKVFIIEDDDFKSKSLNDFFVGKFREVSITNSTSLVDAISNINDHVYDLILVDMAIPSHPIRPGEGAPMSLLTGGLDVLLELKALNRSDPCIIVTQYYEIEICGELYSMHSASDAIKDLLDCEVLGCVGYMEGSNDWQVKINELLEKI
ncbi:hypothetical protein [Halomonas sp. DWK9]|uniref:hypothetical protein n=1 Tax=Halomonas sp. DWK9 TaxID=3060155 RepID=UPI00287F6172|nr:hypothetical protein [Halomonas sp. DWK9]